METTTKPDYDRVLKQMNGAIRVQEMYPTGHPATLQATDKAFSILQEIFKTTEFLTISKVGDRIIINGMSIEGASFPERLLEEFKNENINSLTFTKSLNQEELTRFLSFFVKSFNKDTQPKSLVDFLKENEIHSVKIDQLRFELVSEDEVVVKTEVLEGADLKAQISAIMKDNPDLVRDILLHKSVKPDEVVEKLGSEINLHQLTEEIEKQVKELSDNEILVLVASSLGEKLKQSESQDHYSTLNEMVDLVHKILEDREKRRLLPEVKKMLSEQGIIEKDHLDFLFDEKWLKSQAILDELINMIEKLGDHEVDSERFMFLWHRVNSSEDPNIKSYAINQLLSKLDSENVQTRNLTVSALKETLSHSIKVKTDFEFTYIRNRLSEKIKERLMSAFVLKDHAELLKVIFLEMIKRGELKEALSILLEFNVRLSLDSSDSQEIKEVASRFIQEISDGSTLGILVSNLKEGIPSQNIRIAEEILESLDKDKVAEKLVGIFTVSDRTTRMSALRVLSRLGKSSVSAISALLSNPGTFIRDKETELLLNEQWYKVRNAVFVLGNIPSEKSVQILSKLNQDQDMRVRLEVIKSLERIGGPESVRVILTFLNDKEDEVRKNALTSLTRLGDKSCLSSLFEHFRRNRKDKQATLSAIGTIGGDKPTEDSELSRTSEDSEHSRTIKFLLEVLRDEEVGIKNFSPKEKDGIKITVLEILGKIGSPDSIDQIEKFVSQKKKGLKVFLVNDRLIESANRALKAIRSKQLKATREMIRL